MAKIGPYKLVDVRAVYDRTMMQLSGGAGVCKNGDILAYWSRLTDATMGNEVYFIRSSDQGRTWEMTGMPLASVHEEGSVHVATGMIVLVDGKILLPFADYESGRTSPEEHPRHLKNRRRPSVLKVASSSDHGHHWDKIIQIDLPQFHWVYPYGRIFEGQGGALCLPFAAAGKNGLGTGCEEAGTTASGFVISRDRGETWGEWHAIVPAPNSNACGETTVARCPDGSLLAFHRNNSPAWLQSRSLDDGRTWSGLEPTELYGECGCLVALAGGGLLAAYRRSLKAPNSEPFGLMVIYSEDNGRTWTKPAVLPDPRGRTHEAWHEVGMPDIVQLPSGQIGIIYYSYDPNLPWGPPQHEPIWAPLRHFYKRYLAMAVLE